MAEEQEPPPEPEIFTKCFETDGQLFYGEVKAKEVGEGEEPPAEPEYVPHGKGLTIWSKRTLSGRTICFKKHTGAIDKDCDYEESELTGEGKIEYYDGSVYSGGLLKGHLEGEVNATKDASWWTMCSRKNSISMAACYS
eukprot:g12398.t1